MKEYQKRYYQSEKGKIAYKRASRKYEQTEKGKQRHRKSAKRYYATIKGHLVILFSNIKRRCTNPKHNQYKDYGGRGIKNLFKSSNEFVDYVTNQLKVDPRGLQIDRINNDGHYEKGNIRFVTQTENLQNKRHKIKEN